MASNGKQPPSKAVLSLAVLPPGIADILQAERSELDPIVTALVSGITDRAQGRSDVAFGISLLVAEFLGAIYQTERDHGE
jgi:hypothetical protein